MTDHQRARRARKSKAFFAKLAERAALANDRAEAMRLHTWAIRKKTQATLAAAVLVASGIAACAPTPQRVTVGIACGADAVRIYGDTATDRTEAASACADVQIHDIPA